MLWQQQRSDTEMYNYTKENCKIGIQRTSTQCKAEIKTNYKINMIIESQKTMNSSQKKKKDKSL